jgi:peroxiredoxin family protein
MTAEATLANRLTETAPQPIRRLAIVVRDDAFDRLLTPLTFAWEMGRTGVEVDVLFVLWAVRALTLEGARAVKIDPRYAHREEWLCARLQRDGDPLEIQDFFKLLKSTGHVRLHGCRLAAMTFDVAPERSAARGGWHSRSRRIPAVDRRARGSLPVFLSRSGQA